MEPNKFEKHIKHKMLGREIRPSEDAWKNLSARLETSPKKNKGYLRYAIAASFIGMVIVSVLIFRSGNNESEVGGQIVDREGQESNTIENSLQLEGQNKFDETVDGKADDAAVTVQEMSNEPGIFTEKEITPRPFETVDEEIAGIALKESKDGEVQISRLLHDSEEHIDVKIAEVLAKVDLLEENNESVTDAEIDSLLRKAQEELLIEKIYKNDKSVDAMALLTEVETELDESFRDQIFEKLKSGFLKIRTAVADRNN